MATLEWRISKQIAHLTTSRQTPDLPEEPYDMNPFIELFSVFKGFAGAASPLKLHARCRDLNRYNLQLP
jgi:hypothetical protein